MSDRNLITTGVLRSDVTMSQIVVELQNASDKTQVVFVRVINWNANTPQLLFASGPVIIPVGQIRVLFVPANGNPLLGTAIFAYEVRVNIPEDNKVVVTSFAETAGRTLIAGNTVLFREFTRISKFNSFIGLPDVTNENDDDGDDILDGLIQGHQGIQGIEKSNSD